MGAVDVSTTLIRVQLSSANGKRINVNAMGLNIVNNSPALRALWVDEGEAGGDVNVRYLSVQLDEDTTNWTDGSGEPVDSQSFYVEEGETETIDVLASATSGYYAWNLVISYSTEDGKVGELRIAPGDEQDFETSSPQNAARFSPGSSCQESEGPGLSSMRSVAATRG